MNELTITVLVENTAPEGLRAEHGLAFWLEYGDECWLLDAGQSGLFAENAVQLGIDLKRAKGAILSHGHYDHSGGFETFFRENDSARLWLRESCLERYWHIDAADPSGRRYIGVHPENWPDRLSFPGEKTELAPGLWLLSHSTPGLDARGARSGMLRDGPGGITDDDFAHEQSVLLETAHGLVLLNSCSHGGIDTAVEEALKAFPEKKVFAVLGGFHLGLKKLSYPRQEVEALADRLTELGVEQVYTGHCTGEEGYHILKEKLGRRLTRLTTGMRIQFY